MFIRHFAIYYAKESILIERSEASIYPPQTKGSRIYTQNTTDAYLRMRSVVGPRTYIYMGILYKQRLQSRRSHSRNFYIGSSLPAFSGVSGVPSYISTTHIVRTSLQGGAYGNSIWNGSLQKSILKKNCGFV